MSVRRVLRIQGYPIFFKEKTILEVHRDKLSEKLNFDKSRRKRLVPPTISQFLFFIYRKHVSEENISTEERYKFQTINLLLISLQPTSIFIQQISFLFQKIKLLRENILLFARWIFF